MYRKLNSPTIFSIAVIICTSFYSHAQQGIIKGRVYNSVNNEPVAFANIVLDSTLVGTSTDLDGSYRLEGLKPGTYNLVCSYVGFKKIIFYEIVVNNTKPTILDIALSEDSEILSTIEIKASPFNKTEESPVSVRTIGASEIYRNPGGNRDISKVVQILPGVASTVSFRNDIIVRGGAPNENRFYLDGIEVPNINHFATQGSSGGPVGMLNVNFIRELEFYAGAFPANRGNALSSVLEFNQINGNDEKIAGNLMIGSSDTGITLEGPFSKNSTFILSARRSYLQFLFKALNLPFLPTYNDFQYKQNIKINRKNQLTIIGLGAIDDFELNTNANEGISDSTTIKSNNYLLRNLPVNTQWNYTFGANWRRFSKKSFQTFVISRNHLNNKAIKYAQNIEDPQNLILDYNSQEIENKFRFENSAQNDNWKWNYGIAIEWSQYSNTTFNKKEIDGSVAIINVNSELEMAKFAPFYQASRAFYGDRLTLSFGIRSDFNTYSRQMLNPIEQFSPRFAASYTLTSKVNLNFNVGRYYQLPAYTVLGFRDNSGSLVNKNNKITYIQSDHLVGGFEFNPTLYSKISIESFHKTYSNYPFLITDSISLVNLGSDFGVIGNEEVASSSTGRSYGLEILAQQKLSSSIYGILSYTYVRSEFKDKNDNYIPSSWDNRHILNVTAGKKLKKNWEVGLKFRLLGGAPYTPYDNELSSIKEIWDVAQEGILDWNRLNNNRYPTSHTLDFRLDKKWYFNKWALNMYLDIQNVYNSQIRLQPNLDVVRDLSGQPLQDLTDSSRYQIESIENESGNVLPSIGLMIEF